MENRSQIRITPRKSANERLQRPPAVPAKAINQEVNEVEVNFNNNTMKRSTPPLFGAKVSLVPKSVLDKYKEKSTSKNFDSPNCICLRYVSTLVFLFRFMYVSP